MRLSAYRLAALLLLLAPVAAERSARHIPDRSRGTTITPASVVRAYYQAINRRDYHRAYGYLALPGRLPYATWVRGYHDTERVTIGEIIVPGYRIPQNGSRYTCVGVHFTARQTGSKTVAYGGWYITAQTGQRWSMVLLGSRIGVNAKLRVPSWHTCLSNVPPPPSLGLTALSFPDVTHGWAARLSITQTYLLRTIDGGRSWQRLGVSIAVAALDFVDAQDGWALGLAPAGCLWHSGPPLPCRQVLLATHDGGKTWRQERSQGNGAPFPTQSTLQFLDREHGWLIGSHGGPRVLATSDGGRSWHRIFTTSLQLTSLHFVDLRHGWVAGSTSVLGGAGCNTWVFATTNGGRTWALQLYRSYQCSPDVDFVNGRDGWVLAQPEVNRYCAMGGCGGSFLYRTTDGGRHWANLGQVRSGSVLSGFQGGVVFAMPQVGWVPEEGGAGPGLGGVNVTSDGGRTWTRYLVQYDVHGVTNVALVSARNGWLVGCSRGSTGTLCDTLWHTLDDARHWRRTVIG